MKKAIAIVLSFFILVSFSGCAEKEQEFYKPSTFYYLNREISYGVEQGVIGSELQETANIGNSLKALLQQYLNGPQNPNLYLGIGGNVTVVDVKHVNNTVFVVFSQEFSLLSDIELTLACSCVAMTLMDYTHAERVQFSASNAVIGDTGKIIMTRDRILQTDQLLPNSNEN